MRYDLHLGDLKVGRVVEEDRDFPNLWGRFACDELITNSGTGDEHRLAMFLELNRESTRLMDVEHEQDVSEELSAINSQLEQYNDYIESNDWYLVDELGTNHPILCPILRGSGEIVWRWNPRNKA